MFFRCLQGVRNILNGVIYDVYWNAQYIEQSFLDVHWECAIYFGGVTCIWVFTGNAQYIERSNLGVS